MVDGKRQDSSPPLLERRAAQQLPKRSNRRRPTALGQLLAMTGSNRNVVLRSAQPWKCHQSRRRLPPRALEVAAPSPQQGGGRKVSGGGGGTAGGSAAHHGGGGETNSHRGMVGDGRGAGGARKAREARQCQSCGVVAGRRRPPLRHRASSSSLLALSINLPSMPSLALRRAIHLEAGAACRSVSPLQAGMHEAELSGAIEGAQYYRDQLVGEWLPRGRRPCCFGRRCSSCALPARLECFVLLECWVP